MDEEKKDIDVSEITQKLQEKDDTINNLVDELKELRKKKEPVIVETPVVENKEVLNEESKIIEVVKSYLNKEKVEIAKANKLAAIEKFIANNKEFDSSNDITGLKRKSLEDKLNKFNLSELEKVEDFYTVIEEANILLKKNDISLNKGEIKNPYTNIKIPKDNTEIKEGVFLTDKEKEVIDSGKITLEKYLKMKEKYPAFLDSLLG